MVEARAVGWRADPGSVRRLLAGPGQRGDRGIASSVILSTFGLAAIGVFAYAIRAAAGTAPRPRTHEDRRTERAVTIATVIEFAAAIVLPVLVRAAGHPDWVLPSIAITIGPLLLWLDHRLGVPRYRPVGWALTIGPLVLIALLSGPAWWPPRASAPEFSCSATAVAGFRDLAGSSACDRAVRVQQRRRLRRGAAMNDRRLHVVFGAGQVGRALAMRLGRAWSHSTGGVTESTVRAGRRDRMAAG